MWQVTGASIPGVDHTMPGKPFWKNNQDALYIQTDVALTIGIVADGCGSGKMSEVGSQVGVRICGELIRESLIRTGGVNWERVRMGLLGQLAVLAKSMGVSLSTVVGDYFLFSLLGFIVTKKEVIVFHCGDGTYSVNGVVKKIGPFVNNAPPYLAYGLLGETVPKFEVITYPAEAVLTVAVGTDGVDFIPEFEQTLKLWQTTDSMFTNPDMLRRKFAMLNCEKIHNGVLSPGSLKDDVTLIIARQQT